MVFVYKVGGERALLSSLLTGRARGKRAPGLCCVVGRDGAERE